MSLTIKQIVDLNRSNRAAQNSEIGTLIAQYGVISDTLQDKPIILTSGSTSGSGVTQLVAATSGSRIVVSTLMIQNESSGSNLFIVQEGSTPKIRYLATDQGDGLGIVYPLDGRWKLTSGSALNVNISVAQNTGYSVAYYTE